jgi:RNA polymerase sigma-70 factor, ECF subfamily
MTDGPDPIRPPGSPTPVPLDQLIERHLPALRAFVRLRAGPTVARHESSSDLVQSVCREVLLGRDRFEFQGEAAFKSWLYTTALRKIVEKDRYWRAEKRDVARNVDAVASDESGERSLLDCYATLATPSREVAMKEQLSRVERAFEELSEEQREVVTLHKIVGLSHAEIAKTTGKTEEGCRQLLRRGLVKLAELLEE